MDADDALDRATALGEPAAVLQLLDRHNRDCAAVAERLGVLHVKVPDTVPGSPFLAIRALRVPGWQETTLWWPEQKALVVAEIVGSAFRWTGGRATVGMHIMLRPLPPQILREYEPEHLLVGHGSGMHGPAATRGLQQAYEQARGDLPGVLKSLAGSLREPGASAQCERVSSGYTGPMLRDGPIPVFCTASSSMPPRRCSSSRRSCSTSSPAERWRCRSPPGSWCSSWPPPRRRPTSLINYVPLAAHVVLDYLLAVVLIAMPFIAGFSDETAPTAFFIAIGALHLLITIGTRFKRRDEPSASAAAPIAPTRRWPSRGARSRDRR